MRVADRGFGAMKIGGAELHRACAEHEGRGNAAPVGDPAGGDHRHRHRIGDLRQQREQAHRFGRIGAEEAAGMAARLEALRDDRIDAALLRASALPRRSSHCR